MMGNGKIAALAICAALGLAACAPQIPDSGAGVGFDTAPQSPPVDATPYTSPVPPADAISDESTVSDPIALAPAPVTAASISGASSGNVPTQPQTVTAAAAQPGTGGQTNQDLATETAAALSAASANSGVLPVQASPQNAAPPLLNNPGISDENDFQAVSSRQSIESDAERLARQRAEYQEVTPTAVPTRPEGSSPNIVTYALSTQHAKGTRVYTRSGINLATKAQRNCAKYASPDQAQIDFLAKGGPQKDRLSLDPDGDGYACGWDPAPFRNAVN